MKSFKVPAENASAEFVEKKSRFIGNIFKVESPEEAAEIIKDMGKRFWDASHNVYAYVLENGVMRFSDDGEPSGTAGMPTLEVLKKEEVFNVLCVTTRYYGGTLLGAGGLVRAYSKSAKIALDAAGVAVMTPYSQLLLKCPYTIIDQLKKSYDNFGAVENNADYTDIITLELSLPMENKDRFCAMVTELSAGKVVPEDAGERMIPKRAENAIE